MIFYILLIFFYAIIPPASLACTLNLIYQKHSKYGWHLHYLFKYLITLSFLPLLFIESLDLGLVPQSGLSILFLVTTVILAIAGIKPAIKNKVLYFYSGGIFAGFMEEILYRGIIFGLAQVIWNNIWISLTVSSFAFGIWHLKNYWWHSKNVKWTITQFLYTVLFYGPIFGLMRIYTGDLYLAILAHYLTDATCALAPDFLREKLVFGGRRKEDMDDYGKK